MGHAGGSGVTRISSYPTLLILSLLLRYMHRILLPLLVPILPPTPSTVQPKQHLKEKNMLRGTEPLEVNPSLGTVNFKLQMFPAAAPITDGWGIKWGANIFLYIEHGAGLES